MRIMDLIADLIALPSTPREQAKHLEWEFYCKSDNEAHAYQMGVLLQMTEEKDHQHAQWMVQRAERLLKRALDYLNGELAGKTFLMGEQFYAADILLDINSIRLQGPRKND